MIVSCVREIKQLNAQLRKLKKRNGPVADQIATRKGALIDAMQAECQHPKVFETLGTARASPMRICRICGLAEEGKAVELGFTYMILFFTDATVLKHRAYRIEQGKLLKKLGFNL